MNVDRKTVWVGGGGGLVINTCSKKITAIATYLVEHTLLHIGPIVDLEPE